jgi:hypothetical protein
MAAGTSARRPAQSGQISSAKGRLRDDRVPRGGLKLGLLADLSRQAVNQGLVRYEG